MLAELEFNGPSPNGVGTFIAGTMNLCRFSMSNGAAVTINGAVLNIDPKAATGTQNAFAVSTGSGGTSLNFSSGTITILNPIQAAYTGTGGGREFQITSSGVIRYVRNGDSCYWPGCQHISWS